MTRAPQAARLAPFLLGALTLGLGTAPARPADDPKPLAIGAKAPDFTLPGVDGREHRLSDFAASPVLVVVFTCNHCPTAQAYEKRLAEFHAAYKDKGVALVAISPNDPLAVRLDELGYTDLGDSFDDMKVRASDHQFAYPYLYDGETQATSRAYGVLATPHVFVFDKDRALRYQGRFDDQEVKPVTRHDTVDAVDALLAGKPVPVETTRVFGCSTKWSDKRQSARDSLAKWDAEPVELRTIEKDEVAKLARNDTDKLLVVNLWATWCGPCVEELPELTTMLRMYRGRKFQLVTISLDEPEKLDEAKRALAGAHLSAANYLFRGASKDGLGEALDKDWPGPVPYTVVITPGGKVIYRKTGAFDPLELKRAIVSVLGRTY
jgi:peroxiredoxin